jgi:hypothetical protein
MTTYPVQNGTSYIIDLDLKNSPKATVYGLSTGKIVDVKIQKKHYKKLSFEKGDIVRFLNIKPKPKLKFVGKNAKGKPQFETIVGEYDLWCGHDGYNNPRYVILKL